MKILHASKKYDGIIGGDAVVVHSLKNEQLKNGHDVYVLTSLCDEIQYEAKVIPFGISESQYSLDQVTPRRIISLGVLFFSSFYLLKKIKPDIIHSHSPDIGFILSWSARLYGIPMVNTLHALTFSDQQHSKFKRKSEFFLLAHASYYKITSPDPISEKKFLEFGFKNFVYVPNGVYVKTHKAKKAQSSNIIFVGRIEEQKGLKYLIEACNLLNKEKINFNLKIIGAGSQMGKVSDLVSRFKLNKKVHFVGKIPTEEVADHLASSSIFVLPSLWEGFPLSILEAWAEKCAVLATDVNGVKLLCSNKVNSLLVEPKNFLEVFKALSFLLKNPKAAQDLGVQGFKVAKKYEWTKIAADYEKIYQSAIVNGRTVKT